ncbi:MAG TPA: hypothetical protein VIU46_10910 [Gallionellaceae bacterium]
MRMKVAAILLGLLAPTLGYSAEGKTTCRDQTTQTGNVGKGCQAVPTLSQTDQPNAGGAKHKMDIKTKKVEPEDDSVLEEWVRVTDEEQIRGVVVTHLDSTKNMWEVTISAAEYIRGEPLETKLHNAITKALRATPGVTKVVHEDREVWIVTGNVIGEDLVRACAGQLDRLADAMKAALAER